MKSSTISIYENKSEQLDIANLILSVRKIYVERVVVVIGCPGLPNVVEEMCVGDAVLFETPNDGILEVRLFSMYTSQVEFLISQVSPRLGLMGGFVNDDPNNDSFTSMELKKIAGERHTQ